MSDIVEHTFIGVLEGLDQVDKDQLFCIMVDRLNMLTASILDSLDMLVPENVKTYGKTETILNLRTRLELACDQSLTDSQENA